MGAGFIHRLDECSDFACIFELVKEAVEKAIGRRRVGLSLGLLNLPNHIGAFHQLGSNFIVMNKKLLNQVIRTQNKKLLNAYIFHVLLHEYIHCLGSVNEQETQIVSYKISEKMLGENHLATLIAKHGIGSIFERIGQFEDYNPDKTDYFEVVENFENDNLNYFG